MRLPELTRDEIREQLWKKADESEWPLLTDRERANYYRLWTKDPAIGGRLAHYMDPRSVRVYIKDSIFKPYERERLRAIENFVWQKLEKPFPSESASRFIKPHGRCLRNGEIVCWGNSRDWKAILMAAFERASNQEGGTAHAVVLFESGKTQNNGARLLIKDAANRLGIKQTVWMDRT